VQRVMGAARCAGVCLSVLHSTQGMRAGSESRQSTFGLRYGELDGVFLHNLSMPTTSAPAWLTRPLAS
jgi:hypothetical protein